MTLKEYYDQWLNEVYEEEYDNAPNWMKKWNTPAEALEDCDPVMYRCGYSDFAQSEQFKGMDCDECGETLDDDDIHRLVNDCTDDDELQCRVCAGKAFRCSECDTVCSFDEHAGRVICDDCNEVGEDDYEDEEE